MDDILFKNNNVILVDKQLKCKNETRLDDDTIITIIPNPVIEELYSKIQKY